MRRRDLVLPTLLIALTMALAPASAPAAEGGGSGDGQYIDISPVALPIIVDGRLINYVFVSVRVNLTPFADAMALREKEPFLRDALVRGGHRTPFIDVRDYTRVDEGKVKAAVWRDAVAILGQRNVTGVVISSQTPKQRTGIPRPKP